MAEKIGASRTMNAGFDRLEPAGGHFEAADEPFVFSAA
jgi:hypothetical protein